MNSMKFMLLSCLYTCTPIWNRLKEFGLQLNIHQSPPVGYLQMLWLLQECSVVLTDSGGLQKEAYFSEKPCITLRERTEWVELVT